MARVPVLWELAVGQKHASFSLPRITFLLSLCPPPADDWETNGFRQMLFSATLLLVQGSLGLPSNSRRSNPVHHLKCISITFLNVFSLWAILEDNPTDKLKWTLSWKNQRNVLKRCPILLSPCRPTLAQFGVCNKGTSLLPLKNTHISPGSPVIWMDWVSKVYLAHFQMTRFKITFIPLELISSACYQQEVNKTLLWFCP